MNFYEFYQLINENTISQELKKAHKEYSKEFVEKIISKTISKIHNAITGGLNLHSKSIIAKWVAYNAIMKSNNLSHTEVYPTLRQAPYYAGNTRFENFINIGILFLNSVVDYLLASTDQNGNLNPQLASKFNNPGFTSANLKNLSDQYHEDLKNKQKSKPGRVGKTILSFSDGYSWVDLERGYCEMEKESMGHCGNVGMSQGDTILSLRDRKNVPHLTFILNNGILGEMKGRGNDKPSVKYHPYITELLKLPSIKRVKGGGYKPENNFKLSDLTEEERNELIQLKPKFENDYLMEKLTGPNKKDFILTKDEILRLLDDDDDGDIRLKERVLMHAFNNNRPDMKFKNEIFFKLSNSKNAGLRALVADYHFTSGNLRFSAPVEILIKLSDDGRPSVRKVVASNPNTPADILDKLSGDSDLIVKERVAENTKTRPETLEKLIKDDGEGSKFIKFKVLDNKSKTIEIIEKLLSDKDNDVRHRALIKYTRNERANPDVLARIFHGYVNDFNKVGQSLPSSVALGWMGQINAFRYLIKNPNFPKQELEKALIDPEIKSSFKKEIEKIINSDSLNNPFG